MGLASMFDKPVPDATALVLQLLADQSVMMDELRELRAVVDYQTRLLEWCASGVERHEEIWMQSAAHAERLAGAVIH